MRKLIKTIATTLLVSSVSLVAQTVDIETIKKLPIFNQPSISIQAFTKHDSLYHVKGVTLSKKGSSPFDAYVTSDLKEVVIGRGFDTQTKKALKLKIDMKKYLKEAAYTIGTGKDEYMVFTDPECPYCIKLENILPLMKSNAKFYVYLYPLSFHKNAKSMSYYIMSQKTNSLKQEAMHGIANNSTAYKNAKFSVAEIERFNEELVSMKKVADVLAVSGTPAVFNTDGESVQWNLLLDKYGIDKPIDMQGMEFLQKNKLLISINDLKKKPTKYIFLSLEEDSNLKKLDSIIKKFKNTHNLKVALKLDREAKSIDKLKAIYSLKENKDRVALLKKLVSMNKLNDKDLMRAKSITKAEETLYIPVSYIMQKMGIKMNSKVVVIEDKGNKVAYK